MPQSPQPLQAGSLTWPVWLGLALFTATRIAMLPADPEITPAFSHDSAYIAIVAGNLLAGRGYVNDASWLVFLQPEQLPMPYHNANPLYPTKVAGVAWLTGQGTVWSGLAISAVCGSALFTAIFVITRRAGGVSPRRNALAPSIAIASAATFFAPVFENSLQMLPDALCVALQAWSVVFVVRGRHAPAGILFGLAWLTRSSAVLMLPAIVVYLVMRYGWKPAARSGAMFVLAAAFVAAPWLWHTAVVWGDPLRSDAGYYLFQDYHAHRANHQVEHFWHSPDKPPRLGALLRDDPGGFARFQVTGVPILLFATVQGWTEGIYAIAGLFAALVAACAWQLRGRVSATPGTVACVVFAVTTVVAFVPRARSMELRYFTPLAIVLACMLTAAALKAWRQSTWRRPLTGLTLVLSAAWWLAWTPFADYRQTRLLLGVDHERVALRDHYRAIDTDYSHGGPVVVGFYPYYHTYFTGASGLSIPAASDDYLADHMRRHDARWLVLTQPELEFWRPQWAKSGPPPSFRLAAGDGQWFVFERLK